MASGEEDDVDYIVNMANVYVKGMNMTKKQLLNPTREFMIDFYEKYLITVDEKLGSMAKPGLQGLLGDAMFSSEVDQILCLYCFVNNITNKFPIDYFNLSDICQPTSRSKTTVKLLLNLLLYMQNNEDVVKSIVDEIERHERYSEEINIYKNIISDLSSEIAQNEENYLKEKSEAENITKSTQELEKEKSQDEIVKNKMISELDSLDELLNQQEDYLAFLKNDIAALQNCFVDSNDFADSQAYQSKVEKKLIEMQSATVENDNITRTKKTEIDYLEDVMKHLDLIDSSLDITEELEELKLKIKDEKISNTKCLEQGKKFNSEILECAEEEEKLNGEMYSQTCKFDGILAHIREEQNLAVQESEKVKEHYKNLLAKHASEEKDLMQQFEEAEKELQAVYKMENNVYNDILHQETLLFESFDTQLQQLLNKFGYQCRRSIT